LRVILLFHNILQHFMSKRGSIGVFDSGFGGLTVLAALKKELPDYNYIYLGDNARTPYGTRSFDTVYEYSLQCIQYLQAQGCPLIITACNTASAKALRTIQQGFYKPHKTIERVLGVIRPTAEVIGEISHTKHIGILATKGTVHSESYILEIKKFYPEAKVFQTACPMLVPLIENKAHLTKGARYFIENYAGLLFQQSTYIDTVLLGCTHYPLIQAAIEECLPTHVRVISQGDIIAKSLATYLEKHTDLEKLIQKKGLTRFLTTDNSNDFDEKGSIFYNAPIESIKIHL
jgi:glutamate racemase